MYACLSSSFWFGLFVCFDGVNIPEQMIHLAMSNNRVNLFGWEHKLIKRLVATNKNILCHDMHVFVFYLFVGGT